MAVDIIHWILTGSLAAGWLYHSYAHADHHTTSTALETIRKWMEHVDESLDGLKRDLREADDRLTITAVRQLDDLGKNHNHINQLDDKVRSIGLTLAAMKAEQEVRDEG